MTTMHYIGFDIHKKVISFCEKKIDGEIVDQGMINAIRDDLTAFFTSLCAGTQSSPPGNVESYYCIKKEK